MNHKGICLNCGKPLNQCECDFYKTSDSRFLEDLLKMNFNDDWDSSKITIGWQNINANVAPANEYEYFQQMGDE